MSIFRSGLVKPVLVVCIKELSQKDLGVKTGDQCELVLDMGSMYVIKTPAGFEAVVPKEDFQVVKD